KYSCTFTFADTLEATDPYPFSVLDRRSWRFTVNRKVYEIGERHPVIPEIARRIMRLRLLYRRAMAGTLRPGDTPADARILNLEPGEWVEVRPLREIQATLDSRGRLRGLLFMQEMQQFCGGRFRVFKKVKNIVLETNQEMRTIGSPTVFLEGVWCDGSSHGGCDRACFSFWREEWLRRVPAPDAEGTGAPAPSQ
ncbi:MAG: hypothetical protein LUQ62_00875, partial [Methanomicrobiales archaeon]|nr:hypothetical protein [Methanomicrobiales archaeon]